MYSGNQAALMEHGADIPVIAKIENAEGIENLDEIIKVADGIMVARGDMGVEIPAEDVPHYQKEIIKKCNATYKPVITATQMLDSMIRNPRPTRAEVTDVANAIYDGTDVVMLSGETANGKYPLEALKMMVKIAERTEQDIKGRSADIAKVHSKRSISSAVCNATVQTADNLNAKAIVCPTISGFTARLTSKLKPNAEIIGCSPYDNVLRKMQIYWGVRPLKTATETSTDKIIEHALVVSEQAGYVEEGDTVIVSAGIATTSDPSAKRGLTNTMRVVTL
ncbi:MAG: pyruvate kinase [Lactobacillus rogosae]